ncbi:MAG: T9SS type A sorting domain-containing protein, partial [Fibromonadales bacterium]|nr:T9SS type A sorting domain-containing protein [Fibromonadales bacterium]
GFCYVESSGACRSDLSQTNCQASSVGGKWVTQCPSTQFVAVTGITANIPAQMTEGDVFVFGNAKVAPTNATNSQITWITTGATASINANANSVTFNSAGSATVIATIKDGKCNTSDSTSGNAECNYTQIWQVTVAAAITGGTDFVAVDSIIANFPQFVTKGDAFFLGGERVLPSNATNKRIAWSVAGAEYNANFGLIEFNHAGAVKITATIAGGKSATAAYTKTWTVVVAQPMLYSIAINAGSISDTSKFEAGELVSIVANAAPTGQEFERWRVTSKGKPVALDSANLNSPTLSFVMPKMDLEVRVVYKAAAAAATYDVAVIGGTSTANKYAAGADVTVEPSGIPNGYVFGYWDIFPTGVLNVDNKDGSLTFKMPATDLTIRAIISRVAQNSDGKTVAIADIVRNADVSDWVSTVVGNSEIKAESTESGITITASVSEDGFAAIETDVSPNASKSDSISISYSAGSTWRLYLDIPGIPHVEGYFVTLPATGFAPFAPFALSKNAVSGGGNMSFTIADFKNEFGESINAELAELVTGMSFAPETDGAETEASITIASIDVYMSDDSTLPIFVKAPNKATFTAATFNGNIILSNLPENAKVAVYNMQGKQIYSARAEKYQSQLKIGVKTKGVYLVKVNSQTLRIAVK